MKLGIGEILEKASKLRTNKEKVEYLRQHDSKPLQDIIQYALHPLIKWNMPEGNPPYKPTLALDQEGQLYREVRRLRYFVDVVGAAPNNLKPLRKEVMFVEFLESISPKDAELILLIKNKELPKGINMSVVNETWPGLIPNDEVQEVS